MKNIFFILLSLFYFSVSHSQTVNINPDPNGPPWTVSTVPFGTSTGICAPIEFIPNENSLNTDLPERVINDSRIWWPFIINQGIYNSCVQCAEIAYTYTYEVNRKRNLDAGDDFIDYPDRIYSQHYTYNQAVKGSNNGSDWQSGFCMIRDNGCPSYADFIDPEVFIPQNTGENIYTYWMTGESKYNNGMSNRISEIYNFQFGPTIESLNYLKHWIADHGRGEGAQLRADHRGEPRAQGRAEVDPRQRRGVDDDARDVRRAGDEVRS